MLSVFASTVKLELRWAKSPLLLVECGWQLPVVLYCETWFKFFSKLLKWNWEVLVKDIEPLEDLDQVALVD